MGKVFDQDGKEIEVKSREWYSAIGRAGGLSTKRTMQKKNPDYYSTIGKVGGDKILKERGIDFLRDIGTKSKKKGKE